MEGSSQTARRPVPGTQGVSASTATVPAPPRAARPTAVGEESQVGGAGGGPRPSSCLSILLAVYLEPDPKPLFGSWLRLDRL